MREASGTFHLRGISALPLSRTIILAFELLPPPHTWNRPLTQVLGGNFQLGSMPLSQVCLAWRGRPEARKLLGQPPSIWREFVVLSHRSPVKSPPQGCPLARSICSLSADVFARMESCWALHISSSGCKNGRMLRLRLLAKASAFSKEKLVPLDLDCFSSFLRSLFCLDH